MVGHWSWALGRLNHGKGSYFVQNRETKLLEMKMSLLCNKWLKLLPMQGKYQIDDLHKTSILLCLVRDDVVVT